VHVAAGVSWDEKEISGLRIRCAAWMLQEKPVQMNLHRKHPFTRPAFFAMDTV
jgi:hypothetical protein